MKTQVFAHCCVIIIIIIIIINNIQTGLRAWKHKSLLIVVLLLLLTIFKLDGEHENTSLCSLLMLMHKVLTEIKYKTYIVSASMQ